MPKRWALQTMLVKKEVTYNTDSVPTGALNAVLAFNVTWSPKQGSDVRRKRNLPYFSAADELPATNYVEITGEIELIGHATRGTAPGWGALMEALGMNQVLSAGVSATWTPLSAGHPSATCYINVDGVRQILTGCRGKGVIRLNANQIPVIAFTLWGNYNEPTDTANPAVTLTAFQTPQVAGKAMTPTFTINGVPLAMRSFELDFGNELIYEDLVNLQEISIIDGEPRWQAQVEATALGTFNPFALNENRTAFAISLVHGVGSGRITTLSLPSCRMSRPSEMRNQNKKWEYALSGPAMAVSGNDDYSIVCT